MIFIGIMIFFLVLISTFNLILTIGLSNMLIRKIEERPTENNNLMEITTPQPYGKPVGTLDERF